MCPRPSHNKQDCFNFFLSLESDIKQSIIMWRVAELRDLKAKANKTSQLEQYFDAKLRGRSFLTSAFFRPFWTPLPPVSKCQIFVGPPPPVSMCQIFPPPSPQTHHKIFQLVRKFTFFNPTWEWVQILWIGGGGG